MLFNRSSTMNYAILFGVYFTFLSILFFQCSPDENQKSEEELFLDELMAKMTLDEKIGQLNQITSQWEMTGPAPKTENGEEHLQHLKTGLIGSMLNVTGAEATRKAQELVVENSRLGIPLIFGYDVIHGYQTMFPVPLGETASWDKELVKLSAAIAAKETAASGVHWTFAPMMDVGRDPRWGRVMEGAGEDPYLSAVISSARVQGFQGTDLSDIGTIAACAKHFAGYALAEGGRDYNTVDISDVSLNNVVFPPFKAAEEVGVATFMNSFNVIQGIPASANKYIQRDVLKGKWGFDGFVVSDWNSIGEMVDHGTSADIKDAAKQAMNAGSDMDMEGRAYLEHLEELLEEGHVNQEQIDEAVRRILRIKYRLGLFDDPYKYSDTTRQKEVVYNEEHRKISREIARESMVLLKNGNDILPLSTGTSSIAVIGPLANDKDSPLGSWRASAITNSAVSLLEGIKSAVDPSTTVTYAEGCKLSIGERGFPKELTLNQTDRSGFKDAVKIARNAEVVVMALGEDAWQSGEARSQVDIGLKGLQMELFEAIYAVNKNIVIVLMNGRPLVIPELSEKATAILEAWHAGSEAGNAIADVLFGQYNPSGKLPMCFPRSEGQIPVYYNYLNTGRPGPKEEVFWSHYTDSPNSPLYPFGYGLSYTTFSYENLRIDANNQNEINVSVEVKNTGPVKGKEVVQLYIQDMVASIARPVQELKGFEKIQLEPGESKTIEFLLTNEELGFYNAQGEFIIEPGEFTVMVGGGSQDTIKGNFKI